MGFSRQTIINSKANVVTLQTGGFFVVVTISWKWWWVFSYCVRIEIDIKIIIRWFHSVQFSRSVMSESLQPHESQYARPACPSPIPGVHSKSCPSSRWGHPAISSSVIPFSSCPQSLPASESFPMSQLFAWGDHKYWSFIFSISPSNEHPGLIYFRMDWLDTLAVQGTLKSLFQHHSSKASILWRSAFFTVQLSHPYMTTGKTIALTDEPLLAK